MASFWPTCLPAGVNRQHNTANIVRNGVHWEDTNERDRMAMKIKWKKKQFIGRYQQGNGAVVMFSCPKLTPCKSNSRHVQIHALKIRNNFKPLAAEPHHQIISPAESVWLAQLSLN